MRTRFDPLAWAFAAILLCALAFWLTACGTVVPKPVEAHAIAFSPTGQDAGILAEDADHMGYTVDAATARHFDHLIETYGPRSRPPIVVWIGLRENKDGTWHMNNETMVEYILLREKERSGIAP